MEKMRISDFRTLRQQLGFSQRELAQLAGGVSQMAVSYLERGILTEGRVPRAIATALTRLLAEREKAVDAYYQKERGAQ
jgi:predicted transcriptional regulator